MCKNTKVLFGPGDILQKRYFKGKIKMQKDSNTKFDNVDAA